MAGKWTPERKKAASDAAKARMNGGVAVAEKPTQSIQDQIDAAVLVAVEAERAKMVEAMKDKPVMGRANPGVNVPTKATRRKCACDVHHESDEHYGVKIEPGMHYANVEDHPDSWGLKSNIDSALRRGYIIVKQVSSKFAVMAIPEEKHMERVNREAQESQRRTRGAMDDIKKAGGQGRVTRAPAISIDLSHEFGDPDGVSLEDLSQGKGDEAPDW